MLPPPPIISSPPCPSRDAVDANEDARDDTEPGGMKGDAIVEDTGGGDDEKKDGPAAEVDEEDGGDGAVPDETDMR